MISLRQTLSKARFTFTQPKYFSVAYKATTADVKKLREQTGSPLGDCVKALNEGTGDFEKAKEFLRKKGLAYAEKRADRLATQGLIGLIQENDTVSMIQFSCETDFVAKTDMFKNGVMSILDTIHQAENLEWVKDDIERQNELIKEVKVLASLDEDVPEQTIEEAIKFVISKTQENCQLARVFKTKFNEKEGEVIATYLHNKLTQSVGKIGAVFVSHFSLG